MQPQLEIISESVEQTINLGIALGQLLNVGHTVCLSGTLGAGKTTFVHGIGRGWGSQDRVTSPTYTFVNVYHRAEDRQILYHLDAYRLESEEAAFSIGLEEILDGSAAVVIEWPERIRAFLPDEHVWMAIEDDEDSPDRRMITLTGQGSSHTALLNQLHQHLQKTSD